MWRRRFKRRRTFGRQRRGTNRRFKRAFGRGRKTKRWPRWFKKHWKKYRPEKKWLISTTATTNIQSPAGTGDTFRPFSSIPSGAAVGTGPNQFIGDQIVDVKVNGKFTFVLNNASSQPSGIRIIICQCLSEFDISGAQQSFPSGMIMAGGWLSLAAGDANIINFGYDPDLGKKKWWRVLKDKTYWFSATAPSASVPVANRIRVLKYIFKIKKLYTGTSPAGQLGKFYPYFFIFSNEASTNFPTFSHYSKCSWADP